MPDGEAGGCLHQGSCLALGWHHDWHCPHPRQGGGGQPWGGSGLLARGLGLRPIGPVQSVPVDWHVGMMAMDPVDRGREIEGQRLAGEAGGRRERSAPGVAERRPVAHGAAGGSGDGGRVRGRLGGIQLVVPGRVHGGQGAVFGDNV